MQAQPQLSGSFIVEVVARAASIGHPRLARNNEGLDNVRIDEGRTFEA
jgi:hypothetical protein